MGGWSKNCQARRGVRKTRLSARGAKENEKRLQRLAEIEAEKKAGVQPLNVLA